MTPIRAIEWIVQRGATLTNIQISIMNYRKQTFDGIYECRVNYTTKGVEHFETKKFKLKYQGDIFENSNQVRLNFEKINTFGYNRIEN